MHHPPRPASTQDALLKELDRLSSACYRAADLATSCGLMTMGDDLSEALHFFLGLSSDVALRRYRTPRAPLAARVRSAH